VMDRG